MLKKCRIQEATESWIMLPKTYPIERMQLICQHRLIEALPDAEEDRLLATVLPSRICLQDVSIGCQRCTVQTIKKFDIWSFHKAVTNESSIA
jgi:hypothetical protein